MTGCLEKQRKQLGEEERQGLTETMLRERGRGLPMAPREDCPGSRGLPAAGPTLTCPGNVTFLQLCPSGAIIVLKSRCFLDHQLDREPQRFWVHVRILLPRGRWPHGLLQHQRVERGPCGQRAGGQGLGIPGTQKWLGDCWGLKGHGNRGSGLRVQVLGQVEARLGPQETCCQPPTCQCQWEPGQLDTGPPGYSRLEDEEAETRAGGPENPVTRRPHKPHRPLKHPETGEMAVEAARIWSLMSLACPRFVPIAQREGLRRQRITGKGEKLYLLCMCEGGGVFWTLGNVGSILLFPRRAPVNISTPHAKAEGDSGLH
ncbi:PREDICTED: uncharacterized protein LOC108540634 [Rhinopithecus bieti]|uniref:uncharacterized protein LOC108540634 n=1 Tax=Rhinopithecus bieti TaxID=61621 RepID=UPI00083C7038|nr:PREDICTED: uncharacterized protein LOC108540634 [Rhinopithecus bieti]